MRFCKWMLNFVRIRLKFRFFFTLIFIYPYAFVLSNESISSVINVKIPEFDEEGFISREIHANKITSLESNIFLAKEPSIYIYRSHNIQFSAKTSLGRFDLNKGKAWGDFPMNITGDGFIGSGNAWQWFERIGAYSNKIIFSNFAEITFLKGLSNAFSFDGPEKDFNCSPDSSNYEEVREKNVQVPTIGKANYLEFLTIQDGEYRFLMDGNVSIHANNLNLSCDKLELLFVRDANTTSDDVGRIRIIEAFGNVVLSQIGRKSYAHEMTLDIPLGTAELRGSTKLGKLAKVVDDEWGEASGERIVLLKGKRMVKVIGENKGRPRVELPSIPNLGFDLDTMEKN